MSVTPAYLHEDAVAIGAANISTARDSREREALMRDGEVFRREYMRDAQFIFSRAQHHVHKKTKTGYMPLKACLRKAKRQPKTCKAGFPKDRSCVRSPVLICRGLAKRFGLRVSGRRNALGQIIGSRRCPWQSGTAPAFAVLFRSNTHTHTHDAQLLTSDLA